MPLEFILKIQFGCHNMSKNLFYRPSGLVYILILLISFYYLIKVFTPTNSSKLILWKLQPHFHEFQFFYFYVTQIILVDTCYTQPFPGFIRFYTCYANSAILFWLHLVPHRLCLWLSC